MTTALEELLAKRKAMDPGDQRNDEDHAFDEKLAGPDG